MLARLARLALIAACVIATAASASSRRQAPPPPPPAPEVAGPPVAQPMATSTALGLWQSNFGAVKIEEQPGGGVHGAWTYDRNGQPVHGYFAGVLDGNVLRFTWREPAQPQPGEPVLEGEGWLVFAQNGGRFDGKWWTNDRSRGDVWNGWRPDNGGALDGAAPYGGSMYGGAMYGGSMYGAPYGGSYGGSMYGGAVYGGVPAY